MEVSESNKNTGIHSDTLRDRSPNSNHVPLYNFM
jgi:hypothetical protein